MNGLDRKAVLVVSRVLFSLALGCGIVAGAAPLGAETLFVTGKIRSLAARDLDGDGVRELLVSHAEEDRRLLAIFEQQDGAYDRQPSRSIAVKADAVAYTLGGFDAESPALDVVFMGRRGFYRYPFRDADPDAGIERLFSCELFFVAPHPQRLPFWPGNLPSRLERFDIDGDGLDDFVVPERDRLRIVYQTATPDGDIHFERQQSLPITYSVSGSSDRSRIEKHVAKLVEGALELDFLSTRGRYPYPLLADFDGDGRKDVIVLQPKRRLKIFAQRAGGVFSAEPTWNVAADWANNALGARFADLNGDRKLDLVANRIRGVTASEVKVFLHDAGDVATSFSKPVQILRIDGVFARPSLADADGDGLFDLLIASYRIDLLKQARKISVDELEITHLIYRGSRETPFERRPGHERRFTLPVKAIDVGSSHPYLMVGHDVTGEGVPDLIQIDADRRLRLYKGRGKGELEYDELRVFNEPIGEPEEILLRELDGRPGEEILLRYEREILVRRAAEK